MSTKIKTILLITFVISILLSVSCRGKTEENNKSKAQQTETIEVQGMEYTSAYVCPMHCEGSGSDKKGTCPKCGMVYVVNEKHKNDGHKHE